MEQNSGRVEKVKNSGQFNQLKTIFFYLFPQNRVEISLFLVLFTCYLSYSLLFLFNTLIIDDPNQAFDTIFAFDNCVMFHKGSPGIETHPLLRIFMYPLMVIALKAGQFFGYKAIGAVMVSVFTAMISMGVVYVYRYIKEIVGLSKIPLWVFTVFYAFFFTNMILCFITESYTISIFLLAFTVFCYSSFLKKKEQVGIATLGLFTLVLGGVTVTNGLKGVFPYLFTSGNYKSKFKNALIVGIFFLLCMLITLWLYYGDTLLWYVKFRLNYTDIEMNLSAASFYENLIDLFLGSPIFSSSVIQVMFNEGRFSVIGIGEDSIARPVIVQDFFRYAWQYLWVAAFYGCVLLAIVKNYKNSFVHLLLSFWFVDFLVHFIIGYGMGEGFIFAGHWIYLMPMLLAWGYKSLSQRIQSVYLGLIVLLAATLLLNNINALYNTYQLATHLFPPIYP